MRFKHIPALLKLAGPMILTCSGIMLMQLVDAYVLSLHSREAVAAIGPSSFAIVLFQGTLCAVASYAGTFVAHGHGRGDVRGVRKSAWLGIYTALLSGMAALLLAWPLARLFHLAGHDPQVARNEEVYFAICMAGSLFPLLCGALGGWLAGIGRTVMVTVVTFIAGLANLLLAFGLVLGLWGLPRLGMSGAALATVTAQGIGAILLLLIFARAGGLADAAARAFDAAALRGFLALSVPFALRIGGELTAWTAFMLVVGRLGTTELAASSIAFRMNGLAFFPALGFGQATGILVGHARGAGRDDDVPDIVRQALAVCLVWGVLMSGLFSSASAPLAAIFAGGGQDGARIVELGALLMKFVAAYCLFDGVNLVLGGALAAAGDTRWVARAYFVASVIFVGLLLAVDAFLPGLVAEWSLAVLFVASTAAIWWFRFRRGAWRERQVPA